MATGVENRPYSRQSSLESSANHTKVPLYKVVFAGFRGVGKTSLFLRIRDEKFYGKESRDMTPDICVKEVVVAETGEMVKIQFWDTAGMDERHTLTRSHYVGSAVVLYVYSSDDMNSADELKWYLIDASQHAAGAKRIFIRSKCDLDEQSTNKDEIMNKFDKQGYAVLGTIDTSSKTGDGVEHLLQTVAKYLVNHAKPIKKEDKFKDYYNPPTPKPTCC
ncbi:predicted protein [Nematostella vectensis]|uniref:Uncharacterized protein n=1 Tax=Nematostella vectensis TaxID=45351 RepID=A7SGV9_NEMVE|nr:predicted protein [Nematostella vectensis]|eukprot:XP_001629140.1 predicted protein [Nematostella vectensis]